MPHAPGQRTPGPVIGVCMDSTAPGSALAGCKETAEVELIIKILRQRFEPAMPLNSCDVNWNALTRMAKTAKIFGLFNLEKLTELNSPGSVFEEYISWKRKCLLTNFANVARSIEVLSILECAGIDAILFKGPVRSFKVYHDWDCRPSSDVDILVEPASYEAARATLAETGFSSVTPSDSNWWHHHLGETAFLGPNNTGPTVDLHNKVQQPGTPSPRNFSALFASSETVEIAGHRIRTLSAHCDLMLCIINFAKALRSRSPWILYAHELIVCVKNMTAADENEFAEFCAAMGIERLYLYTRRISSLLFCLDEVPMDKQFKDFDLTTSAFGGGSRQSFFRTRLVWQWSDGPLWQRLNNFSLEITKFMLSEAAFHWARNDAKSK